MQYQVARRAVGEVVELTLNQSIGLKQRFRSIGWFIPRLQITVLNAGLDKRFLTTSLDSVAWLVDGKLQSKRSTVIQRLNRLSTVNFD